MAQGRYSIEVLNSEEAKQGRLARKAKFVVWVEFGDGFVELDAESLQHGNALVRNWLDTVSGAMSASVRQVKVDGKTRCLVVVSPEESED